MNILSIQSHVAYGHVGNSTAFPLQRIGVEVWPVHTVQFSNHTGYASWKGRAFEPAHSASCRGARASAAYLARARRPLGLIGSAEIGTAILEAAAEVKRANPRAKYCCDPVIGDVGRGISCRRVPEFMNSAPCRPQTSSRRTSSS